ncbi:MAG: hypothetical protein ACKV2Q_15760 [Planctomycetaceae bacterium]
MAKKRSSGVNKAAIIREALNKGLISPAEISAYAKENAGLDLDPKYVSVIKSNLRAKAGKARGRRGSVSVDGQKEAMMFALKNGTIDKAKKALEAVRNDPTMAFAISMGGVDQAVAALNDLASHVG